MYIYIYICIYIYMFVHAYTQYIDVCVNINTYILLYIRDRETQRFCTRHLLMPRFS